MKIKDEQKLNLWVGAEKALTAGVYPEQLRTSGLISAMSQGWPSALVRLEEAVRNGINDLQTLDALGEAVYQNKMFELLLPFEHLYRDPLIAIHMARALMMLGQIPGAHYYLSLANDSLLKKGVKAILGVEKDIETAIEAMISSIDGQPEMKNLNYIEYWQALAPIADVAGRKDLVSLAERRLKALAYARPVVHFNQSLRLLAEGEFRAGWKLYDWRLAPESPCFAVTGLADISMWEGEVLLENERLLVMLENGFGDQIFSLRFLHALIDDGIEIEVAAGPEIYALLHASFPNLKIHNLKEVAEVSYWTKHSKPDYWVYCLSVPARGDYCEPIYTGGYLTAPLELISHYKNQVRTLQNNCPSRLPVYGIVWHGDIRTAPMRTRAYNVQEFLSESQILKDPCIVVCLQKDVTPEELAELRIAVESAGSHLLDASVSLHNFAHTAAWMLCLDHMWSCDTATAHLAGALAIRTTVMIRNKSIWHWLCDANYKSVWYDFIKVQYALTPTHSYMFDIRSEHPEMVQV